MRKITNHKSQITNKPQISRAKFKKFGILNFRYWSLFVICFLVLGFFLSNSVWAHSNGGFWAPGDPIVPCGYDPNSANPLVQSLIAQDPTLANPCSKCDLLHLVRHAIDFILVAATPILATVFFVIAGVYMMLGGAKPDMLATGKRMFTNTMIGLLIVMLAWLITNTIIRTLIDPAATSGTPWYQVSCQQVGLGGGGSSGGQCVDFGGGSFQCLGGSNGGNLCDPANGNADCP